MISSDIGVQCGFGSYAVTEVNNYMIEMPDGVKLSTKLWFPSRSVNGTFFGEANHHSFYVPPKTMTGGSKESQEEKFPVILEYLPYRKSDFTVDRDYRRHPWLSSHGYVALRVDMRGCGDSEGLYYDEYLQQEQDDCCQVIKWISNQPWSNKKVGMIGKSWGGFNGLQVAFCQPPELKAVISLYSTDDRYSTDIHHDGGCIIGNGLLPWASQMFLWNARAPDPRNCPNWKDQWIERLQKASSPWAKTWLEHQLRETYWKHGSICEDYTKVTCPVLAIGGWKDGYRDAVFRMLQHLPNVKAIIGPWVHEWPDTSPAGPHIEYLKVSLEWFDHHLKGIDNNAMKEPKFRLYVQSHMLPNPDSSHDRPGKWIALDGWHTDKVKEQILNGQNELGLVNTESTSDKWFQVPFSVGAGLHHGSWLEFGGPYGPSNQGFSDGQCLQFTTDELHDQLCIVGNAKLDCTLKIMNHNQGNIAVKLVDIFPTGESTFITYGVLNLTHIDGHSDKEVKYLNPTKEYFISIELHAISYIIPPGHRLKLCITSAYWPIMWPSSKETEIMIKHPKLRLPTLYQIQDCNYSHPFFNTSNPSLGPVIQHTVLDPLDTGITLHLDLSNRKHKLVQKSGNPRTFYQHLGYIVREKSTEIYEIEEGNPLTAKATCLNEHELEYPDYQDTGVKIKVATESTIKASDKLFYLDCSLTTWLNGKLFHENKWHDEIERLYV